MPDPVRELETLDFSLSPLLIPERFRRVLYNGAHHPGAAGVVGLDGGANCQQFAYELIRHFGFAPPDYRSSELWEDEAHTQVVTGELEPCDLLLFNRTPVAWGAHVAVYLGGGRAIHLAKREGVPVIWKVADFRLRPEYACFIGAKRTRRAEIGGKLTRTRWLASRLHPGATSRTIKYTRRCPTFTVFRMPTAASCPGPRISRRQMIQAGAASYLGLSLPQVLAAKDTPKATSASADACIVIFLNGGPSHLDMWDPKPGAPAEIRGEFKTIQTSVPGVLFGEHIPKFARQMHRCSVIRSAHHSVNNAHAAAVYCALTGHDRGEIGGGARPDDYPSIGSVVGMRRPPAQAVPPHVLLPFITKEGAGGPPQPGFFGGWLGKTHDPLIILRNPNDPDFALPELTLGPDIDPRRFEARRLLDEKLAAARKGGSASELEGIRGKAYDLLSAPAMREAVRLDREPEKLRDSYGRNIYGQSVLLSRRLIEAGSRVACVSWAPDANATWDTHGNNFTKLKGELLPQLDAAFSTLLDDLDARGMLERTLVVVVGDFGRTPKINGAGAGRDHWNFCYSLVMAGGGVKGGYVHGASDKIGAKPSRNPVTPADVIATVYECLGVPHDLELRDRLARPFVLCPWGNPIREVLA